MEQFNANFFDARRIKPEDLVVGHAYPLVKLERVNSEFGDGIVAKLKLGDEIVFIYLPRHYSTKLGDAALDEINDKTNHFNLVYKGPSGKTYKYLLEKVSGEHDTTQ